MVLSIIIVNYNTRELTRRCLASVYQNTSGLEFEVIVVDNSSADNSAEMIKQDFPQVRLIENNKNTGYAFANNQGIKMASGDYVLLLNSDTEVLPGSLSKMVQFMSQRMDVGIAGCKLLNADRSLQLSVRKFPSLWDQIIILTKLHNFFPSLIKKYLCLDFDYSREQDVEQVMGAFMLIRRAVIDKIGGLDQNTFFWYDDTDYCLRAKNAGWRIVYTPIAEIVHLKGLTAAKFLPVFKQILLVKSSLYYFKKHQGIASYIILLPFAGLSLFLASLVQLFKIKKKNKQL